MWNLVSLELFKIFRKPRTYIAFAAITAIIGLIQLGFYVDGEAYIKFGMQALSDNFDIEGKVLNGYLLAYIILQTLLIHVPLLIALVAGDMISGEANMGTLRLLVSKPVSRDKLISSKLIASYIYIDLSWNMGKEGGFPMNSLSVDGALMFCRWLFEQTGIFYRLPTEAEWEYACRAGSQATYFFGDDPSKLNDYAWYAPNSNKKYQKVGQKKTNPWGLYDMLGNLSEWTMDQYADKYFDSIKAKFIRVQHI